MRFSFFFLFAIVAACMSVGSATKCYLCTAILTDECSAHLGDLNNPLILQRECSGKCITLAVPKEQTFGKDLTSRMCLPYEGLPLQGGQGTLTIDGCRNMQYCEVCEGDLCNN